MQSQVSESNRTIRHLGKPNREFVRVKKNKRPRGINELARLASKM